MLTRLDRYLLSRITRRFVFLALGFLLVAILGLALRLLSQSTSPLLSPLLLALLLLVTLPGLLPFLLPASLLLAITSVVGDLHDDRALIALEASGIAPGRLFRPIFLFSLLIAALTAASMGELEPSLRRSVRARLPALEHLALQSALASSPSFSLATGLTVTRIEHDSALLVLDARQSPPHFIHTSGIGLEDSPKDSPPRLVLGSGYLQRLAPDGSLEQVRFSALELPLDLPPLPFPLTTSDRDTLDLTAHIAELEARQQPRLRDELALLRRTLQPFSCLLLALVGFTLGRRSAQPPLLRGVWASVLLLVYYATFRALETGATGLESASSTFAALPFSPAQALWTLQLGLLAVGVLLWRRRG